jgi:hypothetical protein
MAPLPPARGVDEPDAVRGLEMGDGDVLPLVCCGDLECRRGLLGETGHDLFLNAWASLETEGKREKFSGGNDYLGHERPT